MEFQIFLKTMKTIYSFYSRENKCCYMNRKAKAFEKILIELKCILFFLIYKLLKFKGSHKAKRIKNQPYTAIAMGSYIYLN